MSLNSINKCLTNNTLWIFISIVTVTFYLSPLFYDVFYVPTFDNLDSIIIWYKILAESGLIFSDNHTVIPNMMNGLPRLSYPGEFNVILWLYYFFGPKTAFIINEVIIHIVAFFSMFVFLKKYVVNEKSYYSNIPIFIGSLYFSLIPYWSGAGLSVAILPLVTYSLLNIKNNLSTKWDWVLLIIVPLYTSFIFLYIFYIIMAGIYLISDTIKYKRLNKKFFLAIFLMGFIFLLTKYRLVISMFFDSSFISHRTEFELFFQYDFLDSIRRAHSFFISGHTEHVPGLQSFFILPTILIASLLSFTKKRFNASNSLMIWLLILFSFLSGLWETFLPSIYALPIIFLLSITTLKVNKYMGLLLLFQLLLASIAGLAHYNGLDFITDIFPILQKLNITRIAFIQPFIWGILLALSLLILTKKLYYTNIFSSILISFQIYISFYYSYYQHTPIPGYASFQDYYAQNLFNKIKRYISEPIQTVRIISFGLEPAVSLYNNFYTTDGYSANYPLSYKHKFRKIISQYLDQNDSNAIQAKDLYDNWGSKLYILGTTISLENYIKDLNIFYVRFKTKELCNLNTNYLLSSYKFNNENKDLKFLHYFKGRKASWDIYLYKIDCQSK